MSRVMKRVNKKILLAVLVGFLIGCMWLVALRFASYKDDSVHYHANFALYVDGKRDEFKSFTFYEEVQACSSDDADNPKIRVHMHDQKNDVIHVHAHAATWGHFFANLGYGLSNKVIETDTGVYVDNQSGKKLTFILNGQSVSNIANKVIGSEDVLLINYGKEDNKTLKQRFETITKSAHEYNEKQDPSSCKGGKEASVSDRLKNAIGIQN